MSALQKFSYQKFLNHMPGSDNAPVAIPTFVTILFIHLVSRDLIHFVESGSTLRLVFAALFGVCLLLWLFAKLKTLSAHGALILVTAKWLVVFPYNSNHFFLEALCVIFFLSSTYVDADEKHVAMQDYARVLQWFIPLVLLLSGIQKVFYGTEFSSEWLAYRLGTSGSLLFSGLILIIISNLVYMGEVIAGALLLFPRVRHYGVIFGWLLLISIQLVAREFLFGLLFANVLLLYTSSTLHKRVLPVFIVGYAVLLLSAMGYITF